MHQRADRRDRRLFRGNGRPKPSARGRGEQYLLTRGLFRRRSTGAVVDTHWLQFSFPTSWHYDVLRALEYFRAAGGPPDPRLAEAFDLLGFQATPRRHMAAGEHAPRRDDNEALLAAAVAAGAQVVVPNMKVANQGSMAMVIDPARLGHRTVAGGPDVRLRPCA